MCVLNFTIVNGTQWCLCDDDDASVVSVVHAFSEWCGSISTPSANLRSKRTCNCLRSPCRSPLTPHDCPPPSARSLPVLCGVLFLASSVIRRVSACFSPPPPPLLPRALFLLANVARRVRAYSLRFTQISNIKGIIMRGIFS